MITWSFKKFQDLTTTELYAVMALREQVFTFEQKCTEPDLDFHDYKAWHLLGMDQGKLIAYARIFAPGDYHDHAASFGRLVVAPGGRGKGIAREAMSKILDFLDTSYNSLPIQVSAQAYLIRFYEDAGFTVESDVYLEAGIPHQKMRRP
jgi:ElaA protein